MASGYVLKEGLRKKEKTTHEILLKCVIIITSVVPRQFPMQVRSHTRKHIRCGTTSELH
jgi:magnesium-transporting ATPase (P-type)